MIRVDCDVVMIPIVSGYRDQNTRELELTTNYANLLSNWDRPWDELAVVLPVTEIVSARHFDPKAYRQFDKDNGQFGD